MLIISSRANVHANHAFAEADRVLPVDPTVPHDTRSASRSLSKLEVARRVGGQHILVLVHGYNHTLHDATTLYATVRETTRQRFPDAYDHVVGYTWPCGASRLTYFCAKSRVGEAGSRLRRWLEWLWAAGCTIDIACHSLGARVASAALKDTTAFRARNVFMLAAAAGRAALRNLHASAEQVYVFHTRDDAVLGRWYRLFEGEEPLGYAGLGSAGWGGHAWSNVTAVDFTTAVNGHYDYLVSTAFIDYLTETLRATRSPSARPDHASASRSHIPTEHILHARQPPAAASVG